jgi:hypothetical protein
LSTEHPAVPRGLPLGEGFEVSGRVEGDDADPVAHVPDGVDQVGHGVDLLAAPFICSPVACCVERDEHGASQADEGDPDVAGHVGRS